MNLSVFSQNTSTKSEINQHIDSITLGGDLDTTGITYLSSEISYGMFTVLDSSYIYSDTSGYAYSGDYTSTWEDEYSTYYHWDYYGADTIVTKAYVTAYKDLDISGLGDDYGMVIDGVDTFAIVHVEYIRVANGIFIDRDYYRDLSDSLVVMAMEKDTIAAMAFEQIMELEKQLDGKNIIIDLNKEEADDCEKKYNKLTKKYKKSRNTNKFLGVFSGVATVVIVILLL